MAMATPLDWKKDGFKPRPRELLGEPLVSADFNDSNGLIGAEADLLDRLLGIEIAELFKVRK